MSVHSATMEDIKCENITKTDDTNMTMEDIKCEDTTNEITTTRTTTTKLMDNRNQVIRSYQSTTMTGKKGRNDTGNENQHIFNTLTGQIVAVLPNPPINRYDNKIIDNNKLLDVIETRDGTMITLTYFDNMWHISTRHGISMNNVYCNGISYRKAVEDVLSKYNFKLNDLKKNTSYTFIISHPVLHPFNLTTNAVFVQAIDISLYINNKLDETKFMISNPTNIPSQIKKICYFLKLKEIVIEHISNILRIIKIYYLDTSLQ